MGAEFKSDLAERGCRSTFRKKPGGNKMIRWIIRILRGGIAGAKAGYRAPNVREAFIRGYKAGEKANEAPKQEHPNL
jgi:hypothetical protein